MPREYSISAALRDARKLVSALDGNRYVGYTYSTWSEIHGAWWISTSREFFAAQSHRRAARIGIAARLYAERNGWDRESIRDLEGSAEYEAENARYDRRSDFDILRAAIGKASA